MINGKLYKVEYGLSILWIVAKDWKDCINTIELELSTPINWSEIEITKIEGTVLVPNMNRGIDNMFKSRD